MRTATSTLLSLALLWAFAVPAQADPTVKKNHMVFQGIHYFKGKASSAEIGAWGEKKTPVLQANYLERKAQVPKKYIDKVKVTTFDLSESSVTEAEFKANVNVASLVGLSSQDAYNKLKNGQYKFALVEILNKNGPFLNQINGNGRLIQKLVDEGNDCRIVTAVIIVISHQEANAYGWSHQGKVEATLLEDGVLKFGAKSNVKGSGSSSYSLSPGSTFAYLLDKPEWDAKLKKNRTKIEDWEDDQHGPY